ncbi:hypothetical protein BDZ97DRAFT_1687355 [Flammula alnicola]|nr:hypothetical protein BDZ97DRAFT_1687355 [Flammula alnicola]
MLPIPPPPQNELENSLALSTIGLNLELFRVVTPIHVSPFRDLLIMHPNREFVDSVCHGLIHGFWPWAVTSALSLPPILDVEDTIVDPDHRHFVQAQRDKEIAFGTFSPPFPRLLPGMLAVPILVATKSRSSKLRMCVNHSAEPFSRNAMIPKALVSVPLDNLHDLGRCLREFRIASGPSIKLVVWKSDAK